MDGALIHPYAMGSSLKDFVNDFQGSYGDWTDAPGFTWKPEKSLFAFWFGVNDIAINHFKPEHGEEYVRAPLQEIFESYTASLNTVSSRSSSHTHRPTRLTSFSSTTPVHATSSSLPVHHSTAPSSMSATLGMPSAISTLSPTYHPSTAESTTCSTLSAPTTQMLTLLCLTPIDSSHPFSTIPETSLQWMAYTILQAFAEKLMLKINQDLWMWCMSRTFVGMER